MPIRPIDMQVSIPKMPEVSRMNHLEQQKSGLQQDQNALTTNKNVNKEGKTVMQSEAESKSGSDADAKKKGRNEYRAQKKKRPLSGSDGKRRKANAGPQNRIDIRI